MKQFIKEIFSETGNISWMRVVGFGVILNICLVFSVHNIVSLSKGQGFIDFGVGSAGVLLTVFGAKIIQKGKETSSNGGDDDKGESDKMINEAEKK